MMHLYMDSLHDDYCVVYYKTYCKHKGEQGQHIYGKAQHLHKEKCTDQ